MLLSGNLERFLANWLCEATPGVWDETEEEEYWSTQLKNTANMS